MRILILIRRFDFGGSENHVRDLANGLAERGHCVVVMGGRGRQGMLLHPGVRFYGVNLSKLFLPFSLLYVGLFCRLHGFDVIHAHQPSAIRIACILGKLACVPVIATIHSTTGKELKSGFTRKTPKRLVYVSRQIMECSDRHYNLNGKCRFIPNGVRLSPILMPGRRRRIVYCSRLDKIHGILLKLLIESILPRLKNVYADLEFEIIGDGIKIREIEALASKINDSLGEGAVIVSGYKESLCSLAEGGVVIGVGRVAMEALSMGVPVIAVNSLRQGPLVSSENYEHLRQTNFVDINAFPPTEESLFDLISQVLVDYDAVFNRSINLRDNVNTDFSMNAVLERTLFEYREVIRENLTEVASSQRSVFWNRLRLRPPRAAFPVEGCPAAHQRARPQGPAW